MLGLSACIFKGDGRDNMHILRMGRAQALAKGCFSPFPLPHPPTKQIITFFGLRFGGLADSVDCWLDGWPTYKFGDWPDLSSAQALTILGPRVNCSGGISMQPQYYQQLVA